MSVRAFPVRLPSGDRYWTVIDEDLAVVGEADRFLRHVRFGRDGSELTTRAYAGSVALYLRWCGTTGRSWREGLEQMALFITWLRHVPARPSGVVAGPGGPPARGARRVNAVLTAVRAFVVHAVASGAAPGSLLPLIYEVADARDLPVEARGEDGRMRMRLRARHRLQEPETGVNRASDAEIIALLGACRSARDRLVVLLMARAGLRRGELCGLRRSDVHLLLDSRPLGCQAARAHLHVVRRGNVNGAWAKSRRQRTVPLDFLVVQAFDAYELERMRVAGARDSDFVLVNLFRGQAGAPLRPDGVGEMVRTLSRRAELSGPVTAHQMRHAFGSGLMDAGGAVDEVAELMGHARISSSQVYLHPDRARLRAAVDRVPGPRDPGAAGEGR